MLKGRMIIIGGPKAMKRGMAPIVKEALQEAGASWHMNELPRHFRVGAGSRYGYQPRTRKYQSYKRFKRGHQRPLEFTGDLKREVTRRAAISGTSKRVRVVMDTGRAWYATRNWKTRGTMPDMPTELTATTKAEEKRVARIAERLIERKLNAIQTRETRA